MSKSRMWKSYLGVPVLAAILGMGAAYAQSLASGDQKALKDMAMANMAEVEAGKMALQKSQNAEVKAFAQQMVDDHGKGLDEVKKVASAKNLTLPTELDAKHKAMAKKLEALSGDKFDREYMELAGVKSHKEAKAIVTKAQSGAKDADVKGVAAKMQPTIDQHMGHVQQLNASLKGGSSMGASGAAGSSGSGQPPKDMKRGDPMAAPGTKDASGNSATGRTSSSAMPDKSTRPAPKDSGNTDSPNDPSNPANKVMK
jgi:putative membrane protein